MIMPKNDQKHRKIHCGVQKGIILAAKVGRIETGYLIFYNITCEINDKRGLFSLFVYEVKVRYMLYTVFYFHC